REAPRPFLVAGRHLNQVRHALDAVGADGERGRAGSRLRRADRPLEGHPPMVALDLEVEGVDLGIRDQLALDLGGDGGVGEHLAGGGADLVADLTGAFLESLPRLAGGRRELVPEVAGGRTDLLADLAGVLRQRLPRRVGAAGKVLARLVEVAPRLLA